MNKLCERSQQQLAESLTAGSTESVDEEVREHVRQCSRCSAYAQALYEDHQRLVSFVEAVEERLPLLEEALIQKLRARETSPPPDARPFLYRLACAKRTPWVAAALLLIGVGLSISIYSAGTGRRLRSVTAPVDQPARETQERTEPGLGDSGLGYLRSRVTRHGSPPLVATATSQPTADGAFTVPDDAATGAALVSAAPAVPVPATGPSDNRATTSPEFGTFGATATLLKNFGPGPGPEVHTRWHRANELMGACLANELAVAVGRSALIVRAEVLGWNGLLVRYRVVRILYGQAEGDEVNVLYGTPPGQEEGSTTSYALARLQVSADPKEKHPELRSYEHIDVGPEMILYLSRVRLPEDSKGVRVPNSAGSPLYSEWPTSLQSPLKTDLDAHEALITDVLGLGVHLDPSHWNQDQLENRLDVIDCWLGETLIARAKLLDVDDAGARWQLVRTLRGSLGADVVVVDHEEFRRRAQALVRYRARRGIESEVEKEAARMRRAELPDDVVGSEALLFLYECKPENEVLRCRLHERLYGADSPEKLKELEERVRAACEQRPRLSARYCGHIFSWESSPGAQ